MRISTAQSFQKGLDQLGQRQSEMDALQTQVTTGKRVNKASDDPAAAARAERALAAIARADSAQRSLDASKVVMSQTDSALGSATDLLQRARELVVASGNGTYSDGDRKSAAGELQQIRDALLALANQDDGAGTFLFGGQATTEKPFVDAAGGVQFASVSGQARTDRATSTPLSSDGKSIFMGAPTGNGVFVTSAGSMVANATIDSGRVANPSAITGSSYSIAFSVSGTPATTSYAVLKDGLPTAVTAAPYTAGQAITIDGMTVAVSGTPANGDSFSIAPSTPTLSVFGVLDGAISALNTSGRTPSQVAQGVTTTLRDLDQSMTRISFARAAAGEALNRIDGSSDRFADLKLAAQTDKSNAEEVDMVHALSDVSLKQTGYDAALKSYATMQRMSLFDYLKG